MKKWLHVLGTGAIVALTAALPELQHAIAAHPAIGTALGTAWTVIGQLLPSPIAK